MSNLEIIFEVPNWIEKGLSSGVLQRVGGVVVDSGSKQVVAWLRDGNGLNTALDIASGIPSPFGMLLSAGRIAGSLWDGKMTRNAIAAVGQQVNTVAFLTHFTATGQIVNLSLSGATFYATMKRLDRLSEEVAKLGEIVRAEFARDRDIQFKSALQAARDVFESNNQNQRDNAVRSAVDGLYKTREHFVHEFKQAQNNVPSEDQLQIAWHALVRAMYAEITRISCYTAANDLQMAQSRLRESLSIFRELSRSLVSKLMGSHPAIYLHKDVPPENVDRFLSIQQWLRHDDPFSFTSDPRILFAILNDLRQDFWNTEILQHEQTDILSQFKRRLNNKSDLPISKLNERLDHAEVVIENYQRLVGFDLELRSLRLSFKDWTQMISDDELQERGFGIIYDADMATRLEHLQL